jgi:hypothetical protein
MIATFGAVIATGLMRPGVTTRPVAAEQYSDGQRPADDLPEAVREAESVEIASR